MIIAEAKIDQILSDISVYVEFGKGKVSVGEFKSSHEGEDYYCLAIREMEEIAEVGSSIKKEDAKFANGNEVILSFPTEIQMISVLAAFTNKSFEVVENKWKAAQEAANKEVS